MEKYIVAYATLFDNVIHIQVVEAESEVDAVFKVPGIEYVAEGYMERTPAEVATNYSLGEIAFNSDLLLTVKKFEELPALAEMD